MLYKFTIYSWFCIFSQFFHEYVFVYVDGLKKVTIKGAAENVKIGKRLIENKVEEDREQRESLKNSVANRTLRIANKEEKQVRSFGSKKIL